MDAADYVGFWQTLSKSTNSDSMRQLLTEQCNCDNELTAAC